MKVANVSIRPLLKLSVSKCEYFKDASVRCYEL